MYIDTIIVYVYLPGEREKMEERERGGIGVKITEEWLMCEPDGVDSMFIFFFHFICILFKDY